MIVALVFTLAMLLGAPVWAPWAACFALWTALLFVVRDYTLRVGIAYDRLFNAEVLNGSPDETVSQRAAWSSQDGKKWGCVLCRILEFFDPGHCARSIEDLKRRKFRLQG